MEYGVGKERLTRNVSPTIQDGAELELEKSKKAPTHCDELACASKKSAGEIFHDELPNVSETVTSVLQAIHTSLIMSKRRRRDERECLR